jgi:hypothetical protein
MRDVESVAAELRTRRTPSLARWEE